MGPSKKCRACGEVKPIDAFKPYNAHGQRGRRASCRVCYNRKIHGKPPLPAVPEGFDVRGVSTQLDDAGKLEKQWLDSRPEAEKFETIQPSIPSGHRLKGVSTLVDEHGGVRAQWIKTTAEELERAERERAVMDAIGTLAEKWPARGPVTLTDTNVDDDLMCVIPMGDPHFGMYAWAAETGDDYDLELAEQYHCTAMDQLVESAPRAGRGLLIDLGDFFHMDNSTNQTLRGHHQLDVDTRWPKVIKSGVHATVWLIRRMLAKFGIVDVWAVPGNHDPHSAFMLQLALSLFFKDEPRVRVADVAGLYYYTRFGENLIGSTHTHTVKDRSTLGETMASDRKEDWGCTTHRYWYCGHVHHDSVLETRGGVLVETLRTLAGKDKFAAESGYRSGRDMKCDVLHRHDGRITRNIIGIRQIQRRIAELGK